MLRCHCLFRVHAPLGENAHIALGEEVDNAVVQRKIDALETELAAPRVTMRGHIRELGSMFDVSRPASNGTLR